MKAMMKSGDADSQQPSARIPALDGIRGVAIALVLCRHYAPPVFGGGGVVGVDLFFVLSGFLITTLLVGEWNARGTVRMRDFYVRRGLRLLPALYLLLLVYCVVAIVLHSELETSPATVANGVILSSTYVYNFAPALDIDVPTELGPLWTLSVEEQFYLVWPFALAWAFRRGVTARRLLQFLIGSILLLWALRICAWALWGDAIYTITPTWADALLAGAVLAIARWHGLLGKVPWLTDPRVLAISIAVITVAVFIPNLKSLAVMYIALLPALAIAFVVVIASAVSDAPTLRVLKIRPLTWLGELSYSLYLWNYLVRDCILSVRDSPSLALAIGIPTTFALAIASRHVVERPALRLKQRFSTPAHGGRGIPRMTNAGASSPGPGRLDRLAESRIEEPRTLTD